MNDLEGIIRLGRLQFLIGGFLLFSLGGLAAGSGMDSRFLAGYMPFMLCHLSLSYSNNFFDFKSDRHSKPTMLSGGSSVLWINRRLRGPCLIMALVLSILSLLSGLLFLIAFSPPFLFVIFLVFANLFVWAYSAHPIRILSRRYGEVPASLAYGILIPGLGALSSGGFNGSWIYWPAFSLRALHSCWRYSPRQEQRLEVTYNELYRPS